MKCLCGRPVNDAWVCNDCTAELAHHLGDVAALERELELTRTRQTRITGLARIPKPRPSIDEEESPLPYDERVGPVADTLRNALSTSVRLVRLETEEWPRNAMSAMAAWLLCHLEAVRHHEAGPEICDDLKQAIRRATAVIDRPADLMFAGPCDQCAQDLYARPEAAEITCVPCQLVYDVKDRREWLLVAAEDRLATPSEIAGFLSAFQGGITADRINQWHRRRRITAHGARSKTEMLFRVGDVLDKLTENVKKGRAS
jgi:hypothetical protein